MTIATARIVLELGDAASAQAAKRALEPENGPHLTATVEGTRLVLVVPPARVASLLATVDDALACLTASEATLEALDED